MRRGPSAGRRLRLLGATVVAATALATGTLTETARAADPLLSQGKPATASSTENAGIPASAAVDGNPGTRWPSASTRPST